MEVGPSCPGWPRWGVCVCVRVQVRAPLFRPRLGGAVLDLKGALLSPGPGWGCASQRGRGTSGPGTATSAGLWLPCAPWRMASGQSKVTAFSCPRGHEGRGAFSSRLSPQPTTPQTLAPLLPGLEDTQSQARLRLRTPRNSRLLRDPQELLRLPRTRANPGGPSLHGVLPGAGPEARGVGRNCRPIGRGLDTL